MEEFWRNTANQAQAYGPQLIKAALVMIAFIIGAFIVRWLIAAAIDRTGLAKKANASTTTSDSKSLGTSLAEAAFWVTILIGLMQALAIAGATQISSALHGVIDPILAYLPNVIGAALIFGIFIIIANVVRETLKAVLVFGDGMPERFGLATGRVNISGIVASVAFAVLVIIGAIMAFDVLAIEAISAPANELLTDIIGIIPNVLAAGVILAIFVLIGRFVANLILKTLPGTGVDSAVAELGLLKGADMGLTASKVIARVSLFLIVLLGLVAALNVLGIDSLTYAMNVVLDMGVQIIFGALIIFAGVFVARLVSSAMDSTGAGATDVTARVMKWIIIILSVILGISRMGLDPTGGVFILDVAKWMVIGGAAAFAIAFGWGGRDWAARILESWRSTR